MSFGIVSHAVRGAVFITALALLTFARQADAAFPGANGKIAFETNRDGNYEIYKMDADGTNSTRLTNNTANDLWPAWSPDGTKIAFTTDGDGRFNDAKFEIYRMNADGSNPMRLTNNTALDEESAWSPDGIKIAFVTRRDGNLEIYAMDADGSNQTNITKKTFADDWPAWSPDGTKIAFATDRDSGFGQHEIYTMNADGSNQTRLTNNSADDTTPDWSPDGTKIAFATDRNGMREIYTMDADGSNQTRLTNNTADDWYPAWSPDGTKIAFHTNRDGNPEIYTMNADGSSQTRVTNNAAEDFVPSWQPVLRNYARPRGATPTRISLTPAYKQCTAPNTTHQAPLAFTSCNPPQPESTFLTVGTPDFNGAGAQSVGSALFKVRAPAPEDGLIDVSLTDVRCQGTSGGCAGGALSPYMGDLAFDATFRITDKLNGGANPSGTVSDLPLRFAVPCTPTGSATIGSRCALSTTINTLLGPSAIVAGKRAIWQLNGDVKLYDGGPTGVAGDPDATLFAIGGLFFP
jgi:Tol biopolymer transport system component